MASCTELALHFMGRHVQNHHACHCTLFTCTQGKKSTGKGKGAKSTGKATALKAGQKRTRRESDNGESDGSGSSSSSGSESDSGSAEKDVEEVEEEAGPSSRPATSNKRARKSAAGGAPRAHKAAAPRARKAGAGEGGTEEGEEEEDMTYPTKKSVLPALSCKVRDCRFLQLPFGAAHTWLLEC